MADILFASNDKIVLPTKYHGDVSLSKHKWDLICDKAERHYYRYNGEKVATTLIAPDYVRHGPIEGQFFYYKRFDKFVISEDVELSNPMEFFVAIIDFTTARVCTLYPCNHVKPGKQFKPEASK